MSRRQLKADDVDGFVQAYWDSVVDLEKDYGVEVIVGVKRGKERGKLVYWAHATRDTPIGPDWVVATAECVWPGHYSTSLHALLYSLAIRLWKALDEAKLDEPTWFSSPDT